MKKLVLYSKPGCHLCEGLQEKLAELPLDLEIRDITTNEMWFQKYQYEIPVLCVPKGKDLAREAEQVLPRLSPRASVSQVERMIQKHIGPLTA